MAIVIALAVLYLLIGMAKVGLDLNRSVIERPALLQGETLGGMVAETLLWPLVTLANGKF